MPALNQIEFAPPVPGLPAGLAGLGGVGSVPRSSVHRPRSFAAANCFQ
jgi:hypothetical protein